MKLKRLEWSRRNYEALNELLAGVRPGEIAVFDWDNTCIFGDIGEALLRHMTFTLAFKLDAHALAASVPDRINGTGMILIKDRSYPLKKMKEEVVAAYGSLKAEARPVRRVRIDEEHRIFTSGLLALNRALEETTGIGCEFAYPWVNTLLQGLTPAELDKITAVVIARELKEPLRRHAVIDPRGRWRYDWLGGNRLYPEMQDLAACWRQRGGRVVVSTASNRQLVERMIAMTGFPCREVIGMELAMAGGRFGRALKPGLQPNLGRGKVVNIRGRLGGEPAFVAGDSDNDYEMLTSFPSARVRLVVGRRKKGRIALLARRARAAENGFLVQEIDLQQGKFKATACRA